MPITIKNEARDVLYHSDQVHDLMEYTQPHLVESEHRLDFQFGNAVFREAHFDGLTMGYGKVQVHQKLHIESSENFERVGLYFMLQGEITARMHGVVDALTTSHYQHNIAYNPNANEVLQINQQPDLKVFGLSFTRDRFVQMAANNGAVLDGFAEKVENRLPVFMTKAQPITTRMHQVIDEINNCHFTGGLKKLYLQSKAMELLALQCEQIEHASRYARPEYKVQRGDEERIYHARDLLIAHAQEPLSLPELARKAGINEFKLKSGFKRVFDNTVFGYLSDYRLEQAQQKMRDHNCSLTDIADELGYASLQHFSNAFRKKFGKSPTGFKKEL